LGFGGALLAVGAAYLAVLAVSVARGARARWVWIGGAAAAALLALAPHRQVLVELPPGSKVLATRETLMGLVRVTEHTGGALAGSRTLQVNKHFRMGGGSAFGERRLGHLPLLLAPDAKSTLFLGVATGATLSAVRHYPVERVEAVELVPVMLDLMPLFSEINDDVASDPKVRLHAADARRFVAASRDRFDVIVADLFHPARDGAGTLYAREHFAAVRSHLEPGGLFAQWIPLYQFDPPNLRTVVRTFLGVFPEVHSWLGIYNAETPALVLVGRVPASAEDRLTIDLPRLAATLARPVYRELLMQDPRDLLGAYMLDRAALAAYAGEGPENTDLYPRVLFDAPRTVYENRPDLAVESLASLLPHRCPLPPSLLSGLPDDERDAVAAEVEAFAQAAARALRGKIATQLHAAGGRI
jgi:spermidine synthase